jgi:cell volume regulation protein A
MVVFESSSRFRFREFDSLSASALKLSIIFLILNLIFLSTAVHYLFGLSSFLFAIIFAAVVSGTDPSSTLMILSGAKSKLFELLKVEAILNTPLIVLIPFLIIDMIENVGNQISLEILGAQVIPFVQQFVGGIGTGILVAFVFFRFMRKFYSATLSPLAVLTASLLTYIIAELIGGNGVLAVTTAGLVFGNIYRIKHKAQLLKFEEIFAEVLEILVFVLIGSVISIPLEMSFLLPATILFLFYLLIRFLSVHISFIKSNYTLKEKAYMTLNIPKGIAVAVVVFTLATKQLAGGQVIFDLILLFMIYSIILSTIITRFTKYFTKTEIKISETQ